ncbi:NADP-dependent oxidoreductase [Streptomyces sp. NPDC047315]|uniref:NADP-dependent oxidoreductase n=1 Tax=Streptomyces sp. NPDC047315 TaxID=3155142 RepID=UPI003406F004
MSALPTTGREWQLVARPHGWPEAGDLALREVPVSEPGEGRILVRNLHFSVDPYMRGRMNDVPSYLPPFQIDQPLDGHAVGVVVASAAEGFAVGDTVAHFLGWREYAEVPAAHAHKIDTSLAPASAYLGVLGMPGLTAYAGLFRTAGFKEGDAIFVSGAAGAVGSLVGQMARVKGASRVIGSAGSAAKVQHLTERYGFSAAFNYKDGPVAEQLAKAAPDGIDVYFDNVGGDHLEAAIDSLKLHGRVTLCGAIAQYNDTEPSVVLRNLITAIGKRLRLEGMMVADHEDLRPQFVRDVAGWIASGDIVYDETVVEGIEHGFDAFIGMLRGENTGKMVVSLPE